MKRKIPTTITEEELIEVLLATKNFKHRASYILGFYQAMRISEVINLKPENIIKDRHIIELKNCKGAKDRNIPIIKPLKLSMNTMWFAFKQVPINLSPRALQIAFKNKSKKVLGKDLHFHCLRHSGATWLLNKKRWDVRQVQQFLGHSKLATTEIYTHVSPQDLMELEWGD